MNRSKIQTPPKWWSPKLNSWTWKIWRPLRHLYQRRMQRLMQIEVQNIEGLRNLLGGDHGIMITPNHSAHADPFALYGVADQLNCPFYFMTAWQVFGDASWIKRLILSNHGCFSVDREGADLRALRQAIEIMRTGQFPLVIFPEGEIYHLNDRVTPFRDGPATCALAASKKSKRPIYCLPTAVKYHYLTDPTEELIELMNELEENILWRARPDLPLSQRIYRFAEGALALKEIEYADSTSTGSIPDRVKRLSESILQGIEQRYAVQRNGDTIPERIKELRRRALKQLNELAEAAEVPDADTQRTQLHHDLDDLFLVVQLFSYPGDYVVEKPSIERMAETLDKFEEDMLGNNSTRVRATRRAKIAFGQPVLLEPGRGEKPDASQLTQQLEDQVQQLLTELSNESPRTKWEQPVAQ